MRAAGPVDDIEGGDQVDAVKASWKLTIMDAVGKAEPLLMS
jgi:hypothetical protein